MGFRVWDVGQDVRVLHAVHEPQSQSELLKWGYIGDYIGECSWGVNRVVGVKIIAHMEYKEFLDSPKHQNHAKSTEEKVGMT